MNSKTLIQAAAILAIATIVGCSSSSSPTAATGSSSNTATSSNSSVCKANTPNQTECTQAQSQCVTPVPGMELWCQQVNTACASPNPASCPATMNNNTSSAVSTSSNSQTSSVAQSSAIAQSSAATTCTSKQDLIVHICGDVCAQSPKGNLGAATDAQRVGDFSYTCVCASGTQSGPAGGYFPTPDLALCSPF